MSSKFFRDVDTVAERRNALRQTTDLASGEVVLWEGRPKRGIVFTALDIYLVPFSALWAGGVVFMILGSRSASAAKPQIEIYFSLLFSALAVHFTVGRFLTDAYYRSGLRYIITNQRVVTVSKRFGGSVKSFDMKALRLSLNERSDRSGTIGLTGDWAETAMGIGVNWQISPAQSPLLFRIKNAREVYELLRKAQTEAQIAPR